MSETSMTKKVQQAAQDIFDRQDEVSPSDLINEVSDPNHPAHDAFTWDDEEAGAQFRLIQARNWLRKIVIVRRKSQGGEKLVHVPMKIGTTPVEGTYKPISAVINNVSEFDSAMKEALDDLRAAHRRVEQLRVAASRSGKKKLTAYITRVEKELETLIDSLAEAA